MAPPDTTRTAKHKLLDNVLATNCGTTLAPYVATQRAAGASWRTIAADITGITGEDIDDQTLINWFVEPGTDDGAA
jgi:hypothetical protein